MWPFSRKYSLFDSGLLQGFTDWHSHLLPGVDDGVKTIDETLEILETYDNLGVKDVWLTPHIMEDTHNKPDFLLGKFTELQSKYKGDVRLHLSSENMLDNLFDERMTSKDVMPIGIKKDHLLVETSYFSPPYDFFEKLEKTKSSGYYPILAHPERYVYMDKEDYNTLLDMGVKFQLNLYSLFGMYGPEARIKAQYLLKKDAYSFIGTDTHRAGQLQYALKKRALKKSEIRALEKIISQWS